MTMNEKDLVVAAIKARNLILEFGSIDGAHHKQWLIDQVLRLLTGDTYEILVQEYEAIDITWDEGIAP